MVLCFCSFSKHNFEFLFAVQISRLISKVQIRVNSVVPEALWINVHAAAGRVLFFVSQEYGQTLAGSGGQLGVGGLG